MMKLQQLRDFVAIVTLGGFRSAARTTNVSQSGLTKSLANLENEYGVTLIDRAAKGIMLTRDGEEFLRYARTILLETDKVERWLKNTSTRQSDSISLGVSLEPSMHLAPSVLTDFRRKHPDVVIHITQSVSTELLSMVRDNRLDLAVTRLPIEFQAIDLHMDILHQSVPAIVARAGHPLATATSIKELVGCDWILAGDHSNHWADDASIRELFDAHNVERPRVVAVTESLLCAVSMLMNSDCVARLPRNIISYSLMENALVAIPVIESPSLYNISIIRKESKRLGHEAQLLSTMLISFGRIGRIR